MQPPLRARRRPVFLAGALALLLAGCGGGSSPPPPPPPTCDVPAVVTASAPWQLYGPTDWNPACATLTIRAPALATGERLALVLVNAGGLDNATPSITLSGTAAFAAADPVGVASLAPGEPPAPAAADEPIDRSPLEEGQALMSARRGQATRAWLAAGAPPPAQAATRLQATALAADPLVGSKWTAAPGVDGFCVYSLNPVPNPATPRTTRRPATLRAITPNALFYVTDDLGDPAVPSSKLGQVLAARPDLWTTLASYYEGTVSARNPAPVTRRIHQTLADSYGTVTDVDANGRAIFLFADLGQTGTGGFTIGYFYSGDVTLPRDTSAGCSGSGSNGADMLYLLDPWTFNTHGYSYASIIDQQVPGTMAHELQHDVIFNTRCVLGSPGSVACRDIDEASKDLWLNEGLSMVAEDLAGFGLHGVTERTNVGSYLNCRSSNLCFSQVSLTSWPVDADGNSLADPIGHYGGSHLFLRWLLDRAGGACVTGAAGGCAQTRSLVGSTLGARQAVAASASLSFAAPLTFEESYARYATAALFSGEGLPLFGTYPGYPATTPAPAFDFAPFPAPWGPLHTAVGRVAYTTLPMAAKISLKSDGWNAYVTGVGLGSEATVLVTSSAAVKPRVAVVRFKGSLTRP